jgi:hypothetical protein
VSQYWHGSYNRALPLGSAIQYPANPDNGRIPGKPYYKRQRFSERTIGQEGLDRLIDNSLALGHVWGLSEAISGIPICF